jgi:tetratricopeptide (TPR) repeat protein
MRPGAKVLALLAVAAISCAGCRTLPWREQNNEPPRSTNSPTGNTIKQDAALSRTSLDIVPPTGSSIQLHLDLAKALDSQGQLEKANEEYQRAITAARTENMRSGTPEQRARVHRRLAAAYERLGQPNEAQSQLHEAQRLDPNNPDVWNDTGYAAYLQGKWPEAEKAFRKALAIDRANQRAATNLCLTLAASGRVDEGYEVLRTVSGAAAAHANIAYVLASHGKNDEARSHYQAALREQPQMVVALRGLEALDHPAADATKK